MNLFKSIRWRLQLWHGLMLVAVLIGFGLTAYHLARANQFRRVDQELQERVSALAPVLRPTRGPPRLPRDGEGFPPPRFEEGGFPPPHPGEGERGLPEIHLRPEQARLFEGSDFYYVIWWRDGGVVTRSTNAPETSAMPQRATGRSAAIRM